MEVPLPKTHRHHRHRRTNRRNNETTSSTERHPNSQLAQIPVSEQQNDSSQYPLARIHERNQQLPLQNGTNANLPPSTSHNIQIVATFHQQQLTSPNQDNRPAVLVNGHEPHLAELNEKTDISTETVESIRQHENIIDNSVSNDAAQQAPVNENDGNNVLIRNQSDNNTTIRRHQNQLEAITGNHSNARRSAQLTPHGSPRPSSAASNNEQPNKITVPQQNSHKGIMGFMDRQIKSNTNAKKTQSLSDPQASPAQRSTRSRSSLEKSPRRKRSKSESRRRRERKLIAAGEMEVRQANETLMRYLKQVSEMNDASLSGELEIDHNFDERRVHRKTKSQRDKRGHIISKSSVSKLYAAGGGLSSILKDLSEDIVHGNEIYNPFTPVVSPTDGPPSRIDKMFIQTSSGYRPVDYFKHQIDPESNRHEIITSVNLSCALQRIWILVSNICHGLLGGLALAHLLFIITNRPFDWVDGAIKHYSAFAEVYANSFFCLAIICMVSIFDRMDVCHIDLTNASELISFRWIIIAMMYIATIILTLCAETIDEKLYLTNFNITIFEEEMENNQVLNVWNSLSIARSIGAIFGWVMIGLSPSEDLLYENLLEMEKYQLTNN